MTIPEYNAILEIPDRWISALIAQHHARNPSTRHRPSPRAVRAVLNALALSHRPPSRSHDRAAEPYTDETRSQLSRRSGWSEASVGDVLAVLDGAGWSRVIVRGGKHRGSCRALPILRLILEAQPDDLSGEPPALIREDLNGTQSHLSGIRRDLDGTSPVPPRSTPICIQSRDTSPPSRSGDVRSEAERDNIETIAATITDPRAREAYLRGARAFRTESGDTGAEHRESA